MRFRVRELRERVGLTGTELSNISGVSRGTLWALETQDVKDARASTLVAIADALCVDVGELFLASVKQPTKINSDDIKRLVLIDDGADR